MVWFLPVNGAGGSAASEAVEGGDAHLHSRRSAVTRLECIARVAQGRTSVDADVAACEHVEVLLGQLGGGDVRGGAEHLGGAAGGHADGGAVVEHVENVIRNHDDVKRQAYDFN